MSSFEHVQAAVNLPDFDPVPALAQMSPLPRELMRELCPTPAREAGVLVLIYPEESSLHVVLTRRTDKLRGHSGQISFPGGKRDPQDTSFAATALREVCEELGVGSEKITVVGQLSPIYVPPSNFEVYPIVATIPAPPSGCDFH